MRGTSPSFKDHSLGLVVFAVFVAASSVNAGCSSPNPSSNATTEDLRAGTPAVNGEHPEIGMIRLPGTIPPTASNPSGARVCTGTLIGRQVLITSPLCFKDPDTGVVAWQFYYVPDRAIGTFTTYSASGPNDQHTIDGFRVHQPLLPSAGITRTADFPGIAAVHLSKPVSETDVPRTPLLDAIDRPELCGWQTSFSDEWLYGFGCSVRGGHDSDVRRKVHAPFYDFFGSGCSAGDLGATVIHAPSGVVLGIVANFVTTRWSDFLERTVQYGQILADERSGETLWSEGSQCARASCASSWPQAR